MKIISRVTQEIKNLKYNLSAFLAAIPENVNLAVPYVCQFSTNDASEPSINGELKPIDDSDFKKTGAVTPEEYAKWAFTMCGMVCTAMAIEYFQNVIIKPIILANDALKNKVYVENKQMLSSMRYLEYANWINKYNLNAEIFTRLSLKGIQFALSSGKLVIASVNPNIRGDISAPKNQIGGHLVVVTGYSGKDFYINNPSGFTSSRTQKHHKLSFLDFKKYFAGRGIILSSKNLPTL